MSDEINTLEGWRQNEQLVAWAHKVFSDRRWEALMKIMERSEHVRHFEQNCEGIQKLGRIEGWDLYNRRLALAALSSKVEELPPPKFEPDQPEPA